MPNWCENTARIIALTDEARALLPRIAEGFSAELEDGNEHAFQIVKPMPTELGEHPSPNRDEELAARFKEQYGAADWYDWKVKNWGTKWASQNCYAKLEGDTLLVSFSTAWSPPIGIYERLIELGFDVFATYAECGVGYAGVWENGADEELDLVTPADADQEYPFEDEGAVLAATFPGVPEELRPAGLGG